MTRALERAKVKGPGAKKGEESEKRATGNEKSGQESQEGKEAVEAEAEEGAKIRKEVTRGSGARKWPKSHVGAPKRWFGEEEGVGPRKAKETLNPVFLNSGCLRVFGVYANFPVG